MMIWKKLQKTWRVLEFKMAFEHKSVLLYETVDSLNIRPDGIYVDGTLGGGGHARAAGCTLEGTLEEVKARLVEELRTELTPV